MSLFQRCQKGLNCLRRIRGDVGLSEVDVGGVLPLVAKPCVNDGLCLNERPLLSPAKLALVHVYALLLVVALGAIMPRYALADVTDVSGQDGVLDAAAIVYPYEYDAGSTDQRYRVLSEYLGFDWDSMSSTTKGHLLGEGNGDNVFVMAANNQVFNFVYDTHSYLPILNIGQTAAQTLNYGWLGSLYGHSSLWLVDMDSHNKGVVQDFVAYWALPREEDVLATNGYTKIAVVPVSDTGYSGTPAINGTPGPYYVATMTSNGGYSNEVSSGKYITYRQSYAGVHSGKTYEYFDHINVMLDNNNAKMLQGLLHDGNVLLAGYVAGTTSPPYLRVVPEGSYYFTDSADKYVKINANTNGYTIWYNVSQTWRDRLYLMDGELYLYTNTISGPSNINANGTRIAGYFSTVKNLPGQYVPTPDPAPTPIPDVPDPTEPIEPSEPSGGIDIDLPDIVFPSIDITFPDVDADYRPYLRKILQTLRDTEDDLRSGINQLTAGINDMLDALDQIDRDLTTHCLHLQDAISDVPYSINRYMKQVGNSLYLKLDRSLGDLGAGVNKWLRLIYSRLKGSPSSQPSIDDDEPGFWDWLADRVNNIINVIIDKLPEELRNLLQDLEELTSYFPFSVPWDIAAALALFTHDPVTPVYRVDWTLSEQLGIGFHFDIDMSPWDYYAEIFRDIQFLAFVIGMLFFTIAQFNVFDALGGSK